MEDQSIATLNELIAKTSRIEAHLEAQRDTLDKIELTLKELDPIKSEVHRHSLLIKGFSWFFGIIISIFSAKYFGKF